MYFKVFVKNAKDLPKGLCCNPFVTYQFRFERSTLYTTEEVAGVMKDPVWNYSQVHKIDEVTKEILKEL